MLTFAALMTIFAVGAGGLILDTGRVFNEQSELQAFADMAALAAAGELDGNNDAIARANAAVTQLISDRQSYGNEDALLDINDVTLTFYTDLPAADTQPLAAGDITNDSTQARFVLAQTNQFTTSSVFLDILQALGGGAGSDALVAAGAVAGWTQYQCDITPLMFCVPDGMSGATARNWLPGRQIRLKSQGFWGAGAFGLLDVNFDPDGPCGNPNTGANYYRCAVAVEQSITKCFQKAGVDVRPGQAGGPSESGFNARFDIYNTSLNSVRNNPLFRPAPNVVKGIKPQGGGSCIGQNAELSDAETMPVEPCLITETCGSDPTGRFADGQTIDEPTRQNYVATNYTNEGAADKTGGATNRHQVYLNELTASGGGADILPPTLNESGRYQCSNGQSTDPDRRVVTAAAVDCSTLPPGNASDVPVLDFYRVFLTNPAGFDPTKSTLSDNISLWVEPIEHIDPFGGGGTGAGFVRDFVQLYR